MDKRVYEKSGFVRVGGGGARVVLSNSESLLLSHSLYALIHFLIKSFFPIFTFALIFFSV